MRAERTATPIRVGDVTVTPVAQVRLDAVRWSHGLYVWGALEPIAVLVRRDGREERIDLGPSRTGEGRDEPSP